MSAPYDSIDEAIKAMFAPDPERNLAETRAHIDRAYASLSRLREEVQRQEREAAERRRA